MISMLGLLHLKPSVWFTADSSLCDMVKICGPETICEWLGVTRADFTDALLRYSRSSKPFANGQARGRKFSPHVTLALPTTMHVRATTQAVDMAYFRSGVCPEMRPGRFAPSPDLVHASNAGLHVIRARSHLGRSKTHSGPNHAPPASSSLSGQLKPFCSR